MQVVSKPFKATSAREWILSARSKEPGAIAPPPTVGDGLIVMEEPYTSMVLDRRKTKELRRRGIRSNFYLADATSQKVVAFVEFGASHELGEAAYALTRDEHRCTSVTKPYWRTVSTEIKNIWPVEPPVAYRPSAAGIFGYARFAVP